jgi:hypothetical protein
MITEEQKRAAKLARVRSAAQNLAENDDFGILWEYLQTLYPLTGPSFIPGDEANTHAAAKRDGNKQVMARILLLMSLPKDADFEDEATILKPERAISNAPQNDNEH